MLPLTVGQLKKLIQNLPDSTPVVTSAFDHSYMLANAELTTALLSDNQDYTQDFGESITSESEYGKRIQVLLIN